MFDRVEFDYKIKLKRYLKKNSNNSEYDFLLKEIEILQDRIRDLKKKTDNQIKEEIKKDHPGIYDLAKKQNKDHDFLNTYLNGRKNKIRHEIEDYNNFLLEYQIRLQRLKPLNDSKIFLDFSDTKGTEKIVILEKLGILEFLRKKEPFNTSTNKLASAIWIYR